MFLWSQHADITTNYKLNLQRWVKDDTIFSKNLHQSEAERNGKQQEHDTDKYLYEAHGNFADKSGTEKCGEWSSYDKIDSSLAFQNCKISGKEGCAVNNEAGYVNHNRWNDHGSDKGIFFKPWRLILPDF